MNFKTLPILAPLLFGAAIWMTGCGGGSGSVAVIPTGSTGNPGTVSGTGGTTTPPSNVPAPAPAPTCSAGGKAPALAHPLDYSGLPSNIIVPATSRSRAGSAYWAHTNHLVLATGRSPAPRGLIPSQVQTFYGVPPNRGSGVIVIVDAYDYPTALSDFNVFANTFGLIPETSPNVLDPANKVFQMIYATGSKPNFDGGWAQESALDVQWAHAVAPRAKIVLVEAASPTDIDLIAAIKVAQAIPGVRQISLSFGGAEDPCAYAQWDAVLSKTGTTIFAAVGDTPGQKDFPALSNSVVAVGGTSISYESTGRRLGEVAWAQTGGGISAFEPRPPFQDVIGLVVGAYRGGCDICAVADPQTGVSVYDSTPYQGVQGWAVFGGTSAATPIIAAIANVSGTIRANSAALNTSFYTGLGGQNFHDISSGTSGTSSATSGWDSLTGVGSPNGVGGF